MIQESFNHSSPWKSGLNQAWKNGGKKTSLYHSLTPSASWLSWTSGCELHLEAFGDHLDIAYNILCSIWKYWLDRPKHFNIWLIHISWEIWRAKALVLRFELHQCKSRWYFFDYFIFQKIYSTFSYIEPQWNSSVNKDWVVAIFVLKKEGLQGQCQLFAWVCACVKREKLNTKTTWITMLYLYVRQNFCWKHKRCENLTVLFFCAFKHLLTVNSILLIKLTKSPYLCRLIAVAVNTLKPY